MLEITISQTPKIHAQTPMFFRAHKKEVEESLELTETCFPSCFVLSECGGNLSTLQVTNEDDSPPCSQRSIPKEGLFYNQLII